MGNQTSYTQKYLTQLHQEIIKWKSTQNLINPTLEIPWNHSQLTTVFHYVSKLEGFTISQHVHQDSHPAPHFSSSASNHKVAAFALDLRLLFQTPKLQRYDKTELVSAFIDFLLQLLYHRIDLTDSFTDQIKRLEKELRFLLTVLGDTPFVCADVEQVHDLVAEFEAVADNVGSLVYSLFFATNGLLLFKSARIGIKFEALFKRFGRLKASIVQLSNIISISATTTSKIISLDSLFILDSVINDLGDLMNREGQPIIKNQIGILHGELVLSQSLLKGINVPPHLEIQELNETVVQMRDVAYEAEYLVYSFSDGDDPLRYLTSRLTHVVRKAKFIRTLLQQLNTSYDNGALSSYDLSARLSSQDKRDFEVCDITVVGFEEKTMDVLDKLVGGTEHLEIVSILGMAGLGKTTFAKILYNHPLVNYRFDRRSWCVVSQTYQRKHLLIDILISSKCELNKHRILEMRDDELVEHIYKSLKGRRYLIVMDDIWDSNAWYDLRRCLPDDGNGSRILFTSRNKDVSPPDSIIYALPSLSNDQCWELLEKKVFHDKPCPPQLRRIGEEIATNCCGLPLAVVVIAGILSTMDTEEGAWKDVERNIASYALNGGDYSMMQILKLSYKHLPRHLKPCFLYFGAFPEDKQIPVRKLMRLWIAEGFICKQENKSAENVAEEYLMGLFDKSLIMVSKRRSDGGVKACVIHDLLRELCLQMSEEANFMKCVDNTSNYSIHHKDHRLLSKQDSPIPIFGHHVRSFHGCHKKSAFYFGKMKLLKVLDFKGVNSYSQTGIEFLINLRYLVVNELPASISHFVNLEFLIIKTSNRFVIPSVITKMTKLRYLHVTQQAVFHKDCNVSRTNNLEFLSYIIIENSHDEEKLKCLPCLRTLMHMSTISCQRGGRIWIPIS